MYNARLLPKKILKVLRAILWEPQATGLLLGNSLAMCSCKPSFHMLGKSQTIRDFTVPDFAVILENRQMLVLDSPDSDFGGKWKVRQKLKHAI